MKKVSLIIKKIIKKKERNIHIFIILIAQMYYSEH